MFNWFMNLLTCHWCFYVLPRFSFVIYFSTFCILAYSPKNYWLSISNILFFFLLCNCWIIHCNSKFDLSSTVIVIVFCIAPSQFPVAEKAIKYKMTPGHWIYASTSSMFSLRQKNSAFALVFFNRRRPFPHWQWKIF